jgi:hypothetical protein
VQELEAALANEKAGNEGTRAKVSFLTEKVSQQWVPCLVAERERGATFPGQTGMP